MPKITRKLKSQERYTDIARSDISRLSSGHVTGLSLGPNQKGVGFSMMGAGVNAKYEFQVAMTEDEWNDLKQRLDAMLYGQTVVGAKDE